MEYDDDNGFLQFFKPYLEEARGNKLKQVQRNTEISGGVEISTGQFKLSNYPPCVKKIMQRQTGGTGATRALAFLASFFGQIGLPEEEAHEIWLEIAERWGASAANVFESWFRRMNCPSCRTLSTPGSGYPRIDLTEMQACKPDMKCHSVRMSSPVYYVDRELYKSKLKRDMCR
jgi:DNA primase large subunit